MVLFDALKPAGVGIFKHYFFALFSSHKLDFFSKSVYKKKKSILYYFFFLSLV